MSSYEQIISELSWEESQEKRKNKEAEKMGYKRSKEGTITILKKIECK